jgi:hypothetical protein
VDVCKHAYDCRGRTVAPPSRVSSEQDTRQARAIVTDTKGDSDRHTTHLFKRGGVSKVEVIDLDAHALELAVVLVAFRV